MFANFSFKIIETLMWF